MEQDNIKTALNLMRHTSENSHALSLSAVEDVTDDYKNLIKGLMGVKGKEEIALELLKFNKQNKYYPPAELVRCLRARWIS